MDTLTCIVGVRFVDSIAISTATRIVVVVVTRLAFHPASFCVVNKRPAHESVMMLLHRATCCWATCLARQQKHPCLSILAPPLSFDVVQEAAKPVASSRQWPWPRTNHPNKCRSYRMGGIRQCRPSYRWTGKLPVAPHQVIWWRRGHNSLGSVRRSLCRRSRSPTGRWGLRMWEQCCSLRGTKEAWRRHHAHGDIILHIVYVLTALPPHA